MPKARSPTPSRSCDPRDTVDAKRQALTARIRALDEEHCRYVAAIVIAAQWRLLAHLLGPITITEDLGRVLTKSAMDGFDPNDRRGKEGTTAEDVRKGLAAIEDDADIPVVGELRRENSAFRIVCAFGAVCRQTTLYRRALADAHRVRDQRTPLSAVGADLEKLCDNLAARSSCQEPRLSPLFGDDRLWRSVERCKVYCQ